MLTDALINPFGIDPSEELMHPAQPVENWTEYVYLMGYDLETRHGISIHIGKEPTDPTVWRGTVGIFLDDGDLLVAKYHGRDGSERSAGAGPLKATCIEPFRTWVAEFDGLAHRTSRKSITTEVQLDSIAEMASFHLVFEGAAPMWDLESGAGVPIVLVEGEEVTTRKEGTKIVHFEQLCRVRGEVRYGGRTYRIDGGGVRDHSYGPRDYWPLIGNLWINAVFPSGKAIMLMTTYVGGHKFEIGYLYRGGDEGIEIVKIIEHPFLTDRDTPSNSVPADPLEEGADRRFRYVFEGSRGKEVIEGELLNAMGTSYVSPNHELLGTDLSRVSDGSQLAECAARFVWDGETGVGVRERIVRMHQLRA